MGYKESDKVFYVSATNWQGEEALVDAYEEGISIGRLLMMNLRSFLKET
jgi:hypothetical protein